MGLFDLILHPIDTIENTGKNIVNFVEHPINTSETFFKDEKNKVTHFIEHPIDSVTGDFTSIANEIKAIPTEIKADFKATQTFFNNVVDESEKIGKTIYDDAKWVGHEVEIVAEDVYDGAKALYRFGNKSVQFVENNYQTILFVFASYLTAKYINEVKNAIK